jgi:hypothetical protein
MTQPSTPEANKSLSGLPRMFIQAWQAASMMAS